MTTAAALRANTAAIFNALADEARIAIIERLLDGERCVCELTDALDTAQSRLSYHLRVLKEAGFVTDRREGRWSYYTLDRDRFLEAEELLRTLRPNRSATRRIGCC